MAAVLAMMHERGRREHYSLSQALLLSSPLYPLCLHLYLLPSHTPPLLPSSYCPHHFTSGLTSVALSSRLSANRLHPPSPHLWLLPHLGLTFPSPSYTFRLSFFFRSQWSTTHGPLLTFFLATNIPYPYRNICFPFAWSRSSTATSHAITYQNK